MSSAMPVASRVRDVLLNTSAPSTSSECTTARASAPESTTNDFTPLRSSAAAADAIRSSEASSANGDDTSSPTLASAGGSATTHLGQPLVHERHRHGALADGSGTP